MSVKSALVPVGRKPVDRPWSSRTTKKPVTAMATLSMRAAPMYANPAKAVTAVPKSITGLRPARSAMRPDTNRLKNAPMVNSATIQPIKWCAPIWAK